MKYIAAYLLAKLSNEQPAAADVKKVLDAAGAASDEKKLAQLLELLADKDINELVAEGSKRMSQGGGGGGARAAAPADAGAGGAAKEEKAAPPQEASEEEETDFGLFD
eukprot:Hpha_TRINITY_DN16062_c0_g1::TRINITY_DN16062_c0_g1_i3::g.121863::m.121863/K02943/RP-LP2, RPLP2; large subunit ribosomal protein LP2